MCVSALAWYPDQEPSLVLLHNRDEFHNRPTHSAQRHIISGIGSIYGTDAVGGGTWLAAADDGRVSLVMNYRAGPPKNGLQSRGKLPLDFLETPIANDPMKFVDSLRDKKSSYAPFAILSGSHSTGFVWFESPTGSSGRLSTGVQTMSNNGVGKGWPKERCLSDQLQSVLKNYGRLPQETIETALLSILRDETRADDSELPNTGVPVEIERALSPIFVNTPKYGTRVSTLIIINTTGKHLWRECSFDSSGNQVAESRIIFGGSRSDQ
jgi:uncharacterized protein with NRDE domain